MNCSTIYGTVATVEAVHDGSQTIVISAAWVRNRADVCCVGLEIKLPIVVELAQLNSIWC